MNASALEAILRRDRAIIIAALGVLTALAWIDLIWLANDMAMDGMEMTGYRMVPSGQAWMMPASSSWQPIEFALVFAMWVVMMIGMMTPSAAPIILVYARVGRHAVVRSEERRHAVEDRQGVLRRSVAVHEDLRSQPGSLEEPRPHPGGAEASDPIGRPLGTTGI